MIFLVNLSYVLGDSSSQRINTLFIIEVNENFTLRDACEAILSWEGHTIRSVDYIRFHTLLNSQSII